MAIEQQIVSVRSAAVGYMCLLPDRELRLAGTKSTAEVVYDAFKSCFHNFYTQLASSSASALAAAALNPSSEQPSQKQQTRLPAVVFKPDRDGLALAYKYLTSSTLTVRLCGVAQMTVSQSFFLFYIYARNSIH
jgi:hypothetical protein